MGVLRFLLAPFILKLGNKGLLTVLCLCFLIKLGFIMEGEKSDLYYRSFPFVLAYFLLGSIVYRYRDRLNAFVKSAPKNIHLLHIYVFIITVCLLLPATKLSYSVLLVVICALYLPFIFYITKNIKIDRWLGETSYPIYIFHILVYMVMANNWQYFDWLALILNINHFQLISLLTVVFTIMVSALFAVVELKYIDPFRSRLIGWK